MDNKNPISFEERKIIQLEMLKEIDSFCRDNNIKYSLAFGTLLGAIRHKGFIPWDDDVDIMMPFPDMLRFKRLFKSDTLKYCDIDTESHFSYAFSRITNTLTYNKIGITSKTSGICIDLYPIVAISDNEVERALFFKKAEQMQNKCYSLRKWRSRILRYFPINSVPIFDTFIYDKTIQKFTNFLRYKYEYGSTNWYYIIAGPLTLRERMTYDFDLFESITLVNFEGMFFPSISEYDKFLKLRYDDYMVPPPAEQQVPYHCGTYYWK